MPSHESWKIRCAKATVCQSWALRAGITNASQEDSASASVSEGVLFLNSSKSHLMALPVLDNHLYVNQTRACSDCGWNREWDICMVCLLLQLPASVHGAMFTECVWFTVKSSHSRAEMSTDLDPSQNTWDAPLCSYAQSFLHSTHWHR